MANTSLNLVSLDFDDNKADLIRFLKSQAIFKDYDFEGSNLNVLLDVLAYNTLKNAYYLNMAISEGFIDSAQLKNSIASHAKELNYVPRSIQSAKARVRATFLATGTTQPYIIEKGSSFSSIVRNNSFIFSIPETITVASPNTSFTFETDIYEGVYKKDSYVFFSDDLNPHPKFEITNENADTRSIVVSVYEDGAIVGQTYKLATSLLDLTSSSKVFFLQVSATSGKYEIYFGDNIIGKRPKNNAIILVDYRVSRGAEGNGSSTFVINFNPTGEVSELLSSVKITTISNAYEGKNAEDIETTRFYAPRYFQTQERAVTESDYQVILKTKFPEINDVTAYGGEKLAPPQFGKVVISVSLDNLEQLPISKITEYYNFIKNRCSLTITPIFINPEYTYLNVKSLIKYNINITTDSVERVKTLVMAAVSNFNIINLNKFNADFFFSKFSNTLDTSDNSIVSNDTDILLYKKINPDTNSTTSYILNFAVPLQDTYSPSQAIHDLNIEKTLTSSLFTYKAQSCYFEDDGVGNIRIITKEQQNYKEIIKIGTIDYKNGIVQINNFQPDTYEGNFLKIYVKPKSVDVSGSQNAILKIEPDEVVLSIEQVTL